MTSRVTCSIASAAPGGQHACLVADALGMKAMLIHPFSGVLSAYGIGLASVFASRQQAVYAAARREGSLPALEAAIAKLETRPRRARRARDRRSASAIVAAKLHVRYDGTDTTLPVDFSAAAIEAAKALRGGAQGAIRLCLRDTRWLSKRSRSKVERAAGHGDEPDRRSRSRRDAGDKQSIYFEGAWREARVYRRETLSPGSRLDGPALVIEPHQTIVVEPGWRATVTAKNHLLLDADDQDDAARGDRDASRPDPARSLQQPLHVDRRADGRDAAEHRLFRQHQGAPRLFLRRVRSRRRR